MYQKVLFSLGNYRDGRPFGVYTEVNNFYVMSMTIINMHERFHLMHSVYSASKPARDIIGYLLAAPG